MIFGMASRVTGFTSWHRITSPFLTFPTTWLTKADASGRFQSEESRLHSTGVMRVLLRMFALMAGLILPQGGRKVRG